MERFCGVCAWCGGYFWLDCYITDPYAYSGRIHDTYSDRAYLVRVGSLSLAAIATATKVHPLRIWYSIKTRHKLASISVKSLYSGAKLL
jgi:hypothetical protein